jgi:hypothetical protein
MDLSTRLRTLRRESGRTATVDQTGPLMISQPAAAVTTETARPGETLSLREAQLSRALGAVWLVPGLLYREELLAEDYRHGEHGLQPVLGIGPEPLGVAIPPAERGWWFFDTETTGLAGGTGTLVFLFGGIQCDGRTFRLRQWLLTAFSAEAALMTVVQQTFNAAALLVSFNGKSFDLPLLRTRQRLHRQQLQEQHLAHLDLLHPARSAFAARWPNVRLQTAERRLCDYHRSDDLPGAEAPLAFTSWLRGGDGRDLLRVMQHHRDDVLSLITLCTALVAIYRDPTSQDADEAGILRRLRRRGYRVRAGQGRLALTP